MSRHETYPWSALIAVGDYFVVPYDLKPYSYMTRLVSQRNWRNNTVGDSPKYACAKIESGTIIFVAEVGGRAPFSNFQTDNGIFGYAESMNNVPAVSIGLSEIGKFKHPVRTQSQRVAMLSLEQKTANLPWWFNPQTGLMVANPSVMTEADIQKYLIEKEPLPDENDPYPEYYNLDDSFMRRDPSDEEDEDFGEHPTFENEDEYGHSE